MFNLFKKDYRVVEIVGDVTIIHHLQKPFNDNDKKTIEDLLHKYPHAEKFKNGITVYF